MIMSRSMRKLALFAHVSCSVAALGAVAVFLSLSVVGLVNSDAQIVRAVYIIANMVTWNVIIPLLIGGVLTGLVQALGTGWGLFRDYWVVGKLVLTVATVLVLALQLKGISAVATLAVQSGAGDTDLVHVRHSFVTHAAGGLIVLLVVVALSIFKPGGLTRYGRRKQGQGEA